MQVWDKNPPDEDVEPLDPSRVHEVPWQVFLSHTWPDEPFLKREVVRNQAHRFFLLNCKSANPRIVMAYKRRIITALASCGWFVVAISARALLSSWVRFEVQWALHHRPPEKIRVLILERVDPAVIDTRLAAVKTIDFSESPAAGRQRLDSEISDGTQIR